MRPCGGLSIVASSTRSPPGSIRTSPIGVARYPTRAGSADAGIGRCVSWAVSETTTAAPVDEALESARWDLEPLVEGQGDEGAIALLDEAQARAESFADRYRGKVPELDAGALAGA